MKALRIAALAAAAITIAGCTATTSHTAAAPAAQAAPADTTEPPATPTTPPATAARVWFTVTGTGQPDITYGNDSDNRDGGGTLGILGSGNAVPWKQWLPYDPSAEFYDIDAQLQGSGNITCTLTITGTGLDPTVVATGHASGGYNICSAQAAPANADGTSWIPEG